MAMDDLSRLNAERLQALLGLGHAAGEWRSNEMGSVLRHQLAVRIDFDTQEWPDLAGCPGRGIQAVSFLRVLSHPQPSVVLLRRIKDFAKNARRIEGGPLPWAVATVLYHAAIMAALVRGGQRITRLSDQELRQGVEWSVAQAWLEPSLRALLIEGLQHLEAHQAEPPSGDPPGEEAGKGTTP